MEQETFAEYTKSLDMMLSRIADYKELELDNLRSANQTYFSMEVRAKFFARYLRYRDVLGPGVKQRYEMLHDKFLNRFGVESEN